MPGRRRRTRLTSQQIPAEDVAALIARWSEAAQLYLDVDLRGYAGFRHGHPRRGFDGSDDAVEWTARTVRGGEARAGVRVW